MDLQFACLKRTRVWLNRSECISFFLLFQEIKNKCLFKCTKITSSILMNYLAYFYNILGIGLNAKPNAHFINLIQINIFGFRFVIPIRYFQLNQMKYEWSLIKTTNIMKFYCCFIFVAKCIQIVRQIRMFRSHCPQKPTTLLFLLIFAKGYNI